MGNTDEWAAQTLTAIRDHYATSLSSSSVLLVQTPSQISFHFLYFFMSVQGCLFHADQQQADRRMDG